MDQPRRSRRLCSALHSDGRGSGVRRGEGRAIVAPITANDREGLGMKVIAVIVERYGVLPKELWDLNSISDMGAGRRLDYVDSLTEAMFTSITGNNRYNIVNLSIEKDVFVELPNTLRRLEVSRWEYNYALDDLPASLQELLLYIMCAYNLPLVLPDKLQKLCLGYRYNQPLTLPLALVELQLGRDYSHPLTLPSSLKRLSFLWNSCFNLPIALPPGLVSIQFGDAYNHPTLLPPAIEEIRIGAAYTHDLSLPDTLRKIEWCCNRPIQIPEPVSEIMFGSGFSQPVILPASLKKIKFCGSLYPHPINFPDNLEELLWYPKDCDGLVLPEGLYKLTWGSNGPITLPVGLAELMLVEDVPLVFSENLLKVQFSFLTAHPAQQHVHNLPASVQEVTWIDLSHTEIFTHPSTLQHLIMRYSQSELDLSHLKVHKMTIAHSDIMIKRWPRGLKELAFTVDYEKPLRLPKRCSIVGEKLPVNIMME